MKPCNQLQVGLILQSIANKGNENWYLIISGLKGIKMNSRFSALGAAILSFAVTSCASVDEISTEYQKNALAKYSELDIDHFVEKMTVVDDDLETEAVFTTRMGSRPNSSSDPYLSLISNKNDEFMRAIVSKNSGAIVYQMYFSLESSDWRNPYQINFGEPLGSKTVTRIGLDASCTGGGCTNYEDALVSLQPAELDAMISHLEGMSQSLLRFRVKSQSSRDYDSAFSLSELKAIHRAASLN